MSEDELVKIARDGKREDPNHREDPQKGGEIVGRIKSNKTGRLGIINSVPKPLERSVIFQISSTPSRGSFRDRGARG